MQTSRGRLPITEQVRDQLDTDQSFLKFSSFLFHFETKNSKNLKINDKTSIIAKLLQGGKLGFRDWEATSDHDKLLVLIFGSKRPPPCSAFADLGIEAAHVASRLWRNIRERFRSKFIKVILKEKQLFDFINQEYRSKTGKGYARNPFGFENLLFSYQSLIGIGYERLLLTKRISSLL